MIKHTEHTRESLIALVTECEHNGDSTYRLVAVEPLAPEGTAEWAWQMLKLQKPVSHPAEGELQDTDYTKEGFVRCMAKTGWQLYEPKPEPDKDDMHLRSGKDNPERQDICHMYEPQPDEVVIHIGCLSGTIAKSSDPNYFLMLHSRPVTDCNYSIIRFSALDKQTRELVESLLKAQE